MATKKKAEDTAAPKSHSDKSITQRAAVALLKGTGSAALGATVAVVEGEGGERAGKGVRAAMGIAGVASEILLDPLEHPIASEAGKVSLNSAAAITGYTTVKKKALTYKEEREQKERDRMVARLKADMEPEDEGDTPTPRAATVKRAVRKAKKTDSTEG